MIKRGLKVRNLVDTGQEWGQVTEVLERCLLVSLA